MRWTCLILGGLLALLPPQATSQESPPAAENLLTRLLDQCDIHPPIAAGRLTFFPVSRRGGSLPAMLTMAEAIDRGHLRVEELDAPEVERARFVNRGETPIFLMAGEVITGGRQNRTLAGDAIVGPRSSAVLPLYCVQKGRWTGGKDFDGPPLVAPQAVRERAAQKAGQDEVWSEVARANARLGAAPADGDLSVAIRRPENARRLDELCRQVEARLPASAIGVVVACEGTIVGADLFGSSDLMARMRRKVLHSHFSQYGLDGGSARGVDQLEVRRYLQGCYQAQLALDQARGAGEGYVIRGTRTGALLALRYMPEGSPLERVRADTYVVHVALMQPVIPVRPMPMPVPVRPMR